MKASSLFLLLVAASLACPVQAEDKPAPKAPAKAAQAKAKEVDPNEARVKAMQEIINTSRQFANPSPEAAAWFGKLRAHRAASTDAEVQLALETALLFDPAVAPTSPLGKEPVKHYPAPEVASTLGKLAATERALDLGQKPTSLSVAELTELATAKDGEFSARALRLLRRVDGAAAAPLLWKRLAVTTQRSELKQIEEEILRLSVAQVGQGFPAFAEIEKGPLAAKAAWVRIVGVRPSLKADKAVLLGLLKGPANELTEAAWDAVPTVFGAADKAVLEEAAKGLSERLAPRAKAALALLK
ncbi:MAG: hypothetical protein RL492_634 [Verrucomicrobiota bacterium]|jgi:hypothetical protein